jgi:hypothetical protein
MKYLLDTNIIIEGLLGGKKGEDVKNLFKIDKDFDRTERKRIQPVDILK